MSRDIFINSTVLNCSGDTARKFIEYCEKNVKNPKIKFDDQLDVIIEEDFDRRHIKALLRFLEEDLK